MSEAKPAEAAASSSTPPKNVTPKEGNPAFRAMGLPRLRKRLPSRNWLIFFGIIGSWTGAVVYDRRERRRIQQRYCDAVSHLATQQLQPNQLPRKVRIILEAPPGDMMSAARDYFKEYVKPMLVAASLDWEVVEGRREGDVRYKVAEIIREKRRRAGEGPKDNTQEPDADDLIEDMRRRAGILGPQERGGDLVIGRHTWKEYIRGLHEGWLGPLEPPKPAIDVPEAGSASSEEASGVKAAASPGEISDIATNAVRQSSTVQAALQTENGVEKDSTEVLPGGTSESDDLSPKDSADSSAADSAEKKDEKKPEPDLTVPHIRPADYPSASSSRSIPDTFEPAMGVPYPHLLGFLNTPIRIWRFLHRRRIAETTGATVTAFILAPPEDVRPFEEGFAGAGSSIEAESHDDESGPEIQRVLQHEEQSWHKTARKPNPEGQEDKERPWQEDMVTVSAITSRMRTIDVQSFVQRSGLAAEPHTGPTDLAGAAVADAAGSLLAGSSGGQDGESDYASQKGPRTIRWKGSADRMDPQSWTTFLQELVGMETDKSTKPWQQGNQGEEED